MATLLTRYIAEAGERPFSTYGHHCLAFVADWLAVGYGRDAREAWNETRAIDDPREIQRLMLSSDALRARVTAVARAMGLVETMDPRCGDIGLVYVIAREGREPALVGAIRGDGLWYCKTARGVIAGACRFDLAWSV